MTSMGSAVRSHYLGRRTVSRSPSSQRDFSCQENDGLLVDEADRARDRRIPPIGRFAVRRFAYWAAWIDAFVPVMTFAPPSPRSADRRSEQSRRTLSIASRRQGRRSEL